MRIMAFDTFRTNNRHGAIDGERVDGGAGRVLVLDDARDLGRGDHTIDVATGADAEHDGAVMAPMRWVFMAYAERRVSRRRHGQEGIGPQVSRSGCV